MNHVEQRKYTLEKAKAHYRHVNEKFRVDGEGNLIERVGTPNDGAKRRVRGKSLGLRSKGTYANANSSLITADYPVDVFSHNSRKAFYKFAHARNPSLYGNSTMSTKSYNNKSGHGLQMGGSEVNEQPRHITSNNSLKNDKKGEDGSYPISTTEIFNDQFAQDASRDN